MANQTTMLSSESLEIAAKVGEAVSDRYGAEEQADRFRSFDTICSATQDRQDAILELGERGGMDVILVVGGYNSSNTTHLVEIGGEFCPSFHIDCASEITSRDQIRHQPLDHKTTLVSEGWLPEGPVCVGVTAGASTPNRIVGEVIERVLQVRGIDPHDYIEDLPRRTIPLPVAN